MILPTMSRCTRVSPARCRAAASAAVHAVARSVEPSECSAVPRNCAGACAHRWIVALRNERRDHASGRRCQSCRACQCPRYSHADRERHPRYVVQRTGLPVRLDSYETIPGQSPHGACYGVRARWGSDHRRRQRVGIAAVGSQEPGPMPADTETRISRFAELIATALCGRCRPRTQLRCCQRPAVRFGEIAAGSSLLRHLHTANRCRRSSRTSAR